eukprot:2591487-Pyramimonas_sp.AAC.2
MERETAQYSNYRRSTETLRKTFGTTQPSNPLTLRERPQRETLGETLRSPHMSDRPKGLHPFKVSKKAEPMTWLHP